LPRRIILIPRMIKKSPTRYAKNCGNTTTTTQKSVIRIPITTIEKN